jgi:hypothetical protein
MSFFSFNPAVWLIKSISVKEKSPAPKKIVKLCQDQ